MDSGILRGMRIVECSAFVAAPLCGMTLAQMGAEVIRIEPPGGGLDYRRWPVTDEGVSLFRVGLNQSKRSVVIDVNRPEGRELAMALITAPGEDAGILLTNFPPRGWLDYDTLAHRRADLIQLTIQGNRNGRSMVDYTVNPALGWPFLTGPAHLQTPTNHVLPAWDLITGQMAAVGLLTAERHRRRSGKGQHVKLALEDVGLAVASHLGLLAEAQLGQVRGRYGNDLYGAFGRDFVTADGQRVMVVGLTAKQWRALVDATGLSEAMTNLETQLAMDFRHEGNRFRARESIAGLIGTWIGERPLAEVSSRFERAGVCWSRYQTVQELAASDDVNPSHNPMFAFVEQPGVGVVPAPSIPLDFGNGRLPPAPAPVLGAHTREVLGEVLGLSEHEIENLSRQGIIAVPGM